MMAVAAIPAPALAQPIGAITVGAFLSNMMDQAQQAIINARSAANQVEIQAGIQAEIAIANAQSAFADDSDRLFDRNLNPAIAGSLDKIQTMVNDVKGGTFKTVQEAAARGQQIANTLPFRKSEPQLTSITPKFVVPSDAVYPVQIHVTGNFVNAGIKDDDPQLSVNGRTFEANATTQDLEFNVPINQLLPAGGSKDDFAASKVELIVPWEKSHLLGLWHTRNVDHFNFAIGVLPASPGKISLTVINEVPTPQTKLISSGHGRACSQSECGNNDDDQYPQVVPDANWSIVPGSCDLHASAHGDYSISGPDYNGNRCTWHVHTSHHKFGNSGIADYSPSAQETITTNVDTPSTTAVALKWGDSKVFPVTSGKWKVAFDSFDGKHSEFSTASNTNPFLTVDAQLNQITLKAADPSQLNWP
jgi:hypothetical protein